MLPERNWYLIYTKSRQEEAAQENLMRQGYTTYLPMIQVEKRIRGKYQKQLAVMFPRYLFVRLNTSTDNWMPIRSTIGVQKLVEFGGIPARAPDQLILELQQSERVYNEQIKNKAGFCYGEAVEFVTGSLQGYKAMFEKYVSRDRVAVMLNIIGEYTRTFVSRHDLQRV
jgi:transcriptional antiterminator RfaH